MKNLSPSSMDALLHAIELDGDPPKRKTKDEMDEDKKKSTAGDGKGDKESDPERPKGCVINLRFEECRFSRKACALLSDFMKNKNILETISFSKIAFEDNIDFKRILEGIQQSQKLNKLAF